MWVVAPLYSQIDPNRIGEMQRAIKIAQEYGVRLAKVGKNLKDGALDKLVVDYPSHSFVIDRKEARELFTSVEPMTTTEAQMVDALWYLLSEQDDFCYVAEPEPEIQAAEPEGAAHDEPVDAPADPQANPGAAAPGEGG